MYIYIKYIYTYIYIHSKIVNTKNIYYYYYNRVPGAAGGSKKDKEKTLVPALFVDTLRGGRKGDPQH